ncbi:hypothetical protein Dimus_032476 [Dionaea muscipula]
MAQLRGRQEGLYQDLLSILGNFPRIGDGKDALVWIGSGDSFRVNEVYEGQEAQLLVSSTLKLVWASGVPPRVQLFTWFMWLGKVKTVVKLRNMGVLSDDASVLCGFCSESEEDADHLFIHFEGADPDRRSKLIELLDIDLQWRMHKFYSSTPDLPHQRSRCLPPPSKMERSTPNLTSDTHGHANLFFPEEVVVEILARLPVRSLLRFKSVCKTWFSVIGSEYFAGKHLFARSMMFKNYNFENLLVDYHHTPDFMCLQSSLVDINTLNVVHRKFKIVSSPANRDHYPTCWFAGSCNGIVCLLVQAIVGWPQQSILLWNPATGEVKVLQHENDIYVLGFGFDPRTNDYKVMLISESEEHVSVYSSRSDSWKSVEVGFPFGYPRCPKSDRPHRRFNSYRFLQTTTTSSDGRMLNWLGSQIDPPYRRIVISFDLSDEAIVITPLPIPPRSECKCGRKHENRHKLIQNTPDKPCTLVYFPMHEINILDERECFDHNERIIHIWTLDEYGENGSWTKLRSLVMFDYIYCDLFVQRKGGEEVLFEIFKITNHHSELLSCNPITQQILLLRLKGWPCLGYTESLVSINGRYDGKKHVDVEDIDDSGQKRNYYSLVDDTGRTISRFHMSLLPLSS